MLCPDIVRNTIEDNFLGRGVEHEVGVLRDRNRVIKDYDSRDFDPNTFETFYKPTSSLFHYLTDLMLANHLFGDDVRIEGFYAERESLHVVTTQPFVEGKHPSWEELVMGMEAQGLVHEIPDSSSARFWIDAGPAGNLLVTDVHEDNVIVGRATRLLHPIDVHFAFSSRTERLKVLETLGLS